MKQLITFFVGCALLLLRGGVLAADYSGVGNLGDPVRILFQGNSSFTAEEIRSGLLINSDFLLASHPMASLTNFVATIQRKILIGYQNAGFPDAHVLARVDHSSDQIVVQIKEGPRYRTGEIKVTGARTIPIRELVRHLTEPSRPETATKIGEGSSTSRTNLSLSRYLDSEGNEVKPQSPIWKKGEWAFFDAGSLHALADAVTNALRDFGRLFPQFTTAVIPGTGGLAHLQINILDEGPQGVVKEIELKGNKANSREAILKYLDLKPGLVVTRELISRLEERLWTSGRFRRYIVTPSVIPKEENGFKVTLDLIESPEAPPLGRDFSREQKAFLRVREWLLGAALQTNDLRFNCSGMIGFLPAFEALFSSRGIALLLPDSRRKLSLAALLTPDEIAIYAPGIKEKLVLPREWQITTFLSVLPSAQAPAQPDEQPDEQQPFSVNFGGGFQNRYPGEEPFRANLLLAPAAFLGITNAVTWQGNILVITNEEGRYRIDGDSGRPIELSFRASNEFSGDLVFEHGAFERLTSELQRSSTGAHNFYVSDRPMSSAIGFLAGLLVKEPFFSTWSASAKESKASSIFDSIGLVRDISTAQRARTAEVVRKIFEGGALAPLDELARRGFQMSSNAFIVPLEHPAIAAPSMSGMITMLASFVFKFSNDLFPQGSWPWTLAHEAVFVAGNQTQYTEMELKRLLVSNQTGPIGFLATAKLLSYFNPFAAENVATAGLDALGASDFRKDCRLLLEGDSGASRCFSRFADALSALKDEDVQTLGAVLPNDTAEFLQASVRSLRGRKGQPLSEALGPVLDQYWEKSLKSLVAFALQTTAEQARAKNKVESDFQRGMKYYEGVEVKFTQDYVAAAKFFREAADAGHPAAQYMLAQCYEKGRGLEADVREAIKWYEAAGKKGNVEAQTILANLYSDGLNVPRDDVQALTWYFVAAAQGHKPSEVFMRSMQRKMTSDQIEAATTQAARILTNAPLAIRARLGK